MIYSITDLKHITENSVVDMKEHLVYDYYVIIPRYWAVDGFGAINSAKPIYATNTHSIMAYDEFEKEMVVKSITQYLEDPKRYYLILKAPEREVNKKVTIEDGEQEYTIDLNYLSGFMFTLYLKQQAGIENIISTHRIEMIEAYREDWEQWFDIKYDFYRKTYSSSLSTVTLVDIKKEFEIFADTFISYKEDNITVANELFYSSNIEFIVGMFEGFMLTEKIMTHEIGEILAHSKINPSVYTNILNMLFAKYNITKASYLGYPSEYRFSIKFELLPYYFEKLRYSEKKVKKQAYTRYLLPTGKMQIDTTDLMVVPNGGKLFIEDLIDMKNKNILKFIRFDECIVTETRAEQPIPLYDLIMGNGSATNYLLPGLPWAKNSDGDVLAAMAVMTKEGLDAAKKLMMSNINRLKDGTDPDKIRNWIQKDAVLGLYQITKDVK